MALHRALIVEADWRVRKLIRTNLEAQGVEIVEAASDGESWSAPLKPAYDLIMVSAVLPNANGWNVVYRLRYGPAATEVPIIVVTAEPTDSRLLRRFRHVTQLVKPFSACTLLECVRTALGLGAAPASCEDRAGHLS